MKQAHPTLLISEYFDGRLDEAQAAAIEQHLAECQRCRHTLDQMRFVRQQMQAHTRIPVSPFFSARVMARLRAADQDTIWAGLVQVVRPFVWRAAAVMLVVWALLIIWPSTKLKTDASSELISYDPLSTLQEPVERLASDDQALRFALNVQPSLSAGEMK